MFSTISHHLKAPFVAPLGPLLGPGPPVENHWSRWSDINTWTRQSKAGWVRSGLIISGHGFVGKINNSVMLALKVNWIFRNVNPSIFQYELPTEGNKALIARWP